MRWYLTDPYRGRREYTTLTSLRRVRRPHTELAGTVGGGRHQLRPRTSSPPSQPARHRAVTTRSSPTTARRRGRVAIVVDAAVDRPQAGLRPGWRLSGVGAGRATHDRHRRRAGAVGVSGRGWVERCRRRRRRRRPRGRWDHADRRPRGRSLPRRSRTDRPESMPHPGRDHRPHLDNLDTDGRHRPASELPRRFADVGRRGRLLRQRRHRLPRLLAMSIAGITDARLDRLVERRSSQPDTPGRHTASATTFISAGVCTPPLARAASISSGLRTDGPDGRGPPRHSRSTPRPGCAVSVVATTRRRCRRTRSITIPRIRDALVGCLSNCLAREPPYETTPLAPSSV